MSKYTHYARYWLGRHLINIGVNLFPEGHTKSELTAILLEWSDHVVRTVEAQRAAANG